MLNSTETTMPTSRRSLLCSLLALSPALARAHPAASADPADNVSKQLAIGGRVPNALTLLPGALDAYSVRTLPDIPLKGRTGETQRILKGYAGIRLTDLLDKAQLNTADHNELKKTIVVATATDAYKAVFSWSELFNTSIGDGVYVLVAKDSQPLDDSEGRFALLSMQDIHTGPRHVRWLKDIQAHLLS